MANKKRSRSLPEYVTLDKRKGYIHRPYLGRVNGKIKWDKKTKLCPADATIDEVWEAYNKLAGIVPTKGTYLSPIAIASAIALFQYSSSCIASTKHLAICNPSTLPR